MANKEKRERLGRIKKSTSFKGEWTDMTASNGEWLISELEQAWDELTKEKKKSEIKQRAFDRWVPCPDHRDKINRGYESQGCYVCKNEKLQKELEATKKELKEVKEFYAIEQQMRIQDERERK